MHQLTKIVNNHGLIGTDELLNIINDARHDRDETIIRNNDFIARVKDELEGDNYESFVVQNLNKTESVILRISTDQAMLVAMRESKAVRRIVLEKLKQRQPPFLPQSLPEALRLAADLAEEKLQLENQLAIAAPKVEFADRVGESAGVLIGNYAKTVGIGPNKLFAWLRDNSVLIASGSRRNIPMQEYMDRGYFTIKETPYDTNHGVEISFTTKITGKGQQWLTTKLLSAGILKAVGNAA